MSCSLSAPRAQRRACNPGAPSAARLPAGWEAGHKGGGSRERAEAGRGARPLGPLARGAQALAALPLLGQRRAPQLFLKGNGETMHSSLAY